MSRPIRLWLAGLVLAAAALVGGVSAHAQDVTLPNFWDPKARLERPDLPPNRTVRFLTSEDYPPLHFLGPDGAPTGFAVELARAACERLRIPCTIQARRFDTLLDALAGNDGDVVAAGIPIDTSLRRRFTATNPFFRLPARFVARRADARPKLTAADFKGRKVAVVQGTAHEAYLRTFFGEAEVMPYANFQLTLGALRSDAVDFVFADGLSLALWLGGRSSEECCAFAGGPYLESRFFGEGIGFVLRPEDEGLRRALDYALQQLAEEGKYTELYLRFFPVSPF